MRDSRIAECPQSHGMRKGQCETTLGGGWWECVMHGWLLPHHGPDGASVAHRICIPGTARRRSLTPHRLTGAAGSTTPLALALQPQRIQSVNQGRTPTERAPRGVTWLRNGMGDEKPRREGKEGVERVMEWASAGALCCGRCRPSSVLTGVRLCITVTRSPPATTRKAPM
jgi:hypothetical protein